MPRSPVLQSCTAPVIEQALCKSVRLKLIFHALPENACPTHMSAADMTFFVRKHLQRLLLCQPLAQEHKAKIRISVSKAV